MRKIEREDRVGQKPNSKGLNNVVKRKAYLKLYLAQKRTKF